MTVTAAQDAPSRGSAKKQPEAVGAAVGQIAEMQRLLRAKDADGLRKLVLVTKTPDAAEKLDELADAVRQGALAEARVVPLESKVDGPVVCVVSAFLVRPADAARPEVEPSLFLKRDGRWRLIHGSPHDARTIMDDAERAATERLGKWADEWREANRESVPKRLRPEK